MANLDGGHGQPETGTTHLREAVDGGNWRLGSLNKSATREESALWETVRAKAQREGGDAKAMLAFLEETLKAHNAQVEKRERCKTPSDPDIVIGGFTLFRINFARHAGARWQDGEEWHISGRLRGSFMHAVRAYRPSKKGASPAIEGLFGRIRGWMGGVLPAPVKKQP